MTDQTATLLPKYTKQIDLRIQFIHRPIKKNWYTRKYPFLVQNEPFEYGVRIKNIGSEPFSGATISTFSIKSGDVLTGGLVQKANSTPKIKALNPGEELDLYFSRYTFWHEGSIGTDCTLTPDNENEQIMTYQYHRDHDFDEQYKINEWWHDYYCQSQQQLLQTKTNNLILGLTVITVIEAILGLKESLKWVIGKFAWALSNFATFLQWLSS